MISNTYEYVSKKPFMENNKFFHQKFDATCTSKSEQNLIKFSTIKHENQIWMECISSIESICTINQAWSDPGMHAGCNSFQNNIG
jgi:hypothetical protein